MSSQVSNYSILICDDDEISLEINKKYIELFSSRNQITASLYCYSQMTPDLERLITRGKFQIAVLDIELNGINGMELARKILNHNPDTLIIFVTNHSEFALDAFELLAFGFIKKPVSQCNFEKIFNRAIVHIGRQRSPSEDAFLELVVSKEQIHIRQSMIIYIEKMQQKTVIKTRKGSYEVYDSISSMERKLNSNFMRINQSIIVNKNEILELRRCMVYMSTGDEFSIGRTFIKKVKDDCQSKNCS